MVSFYQRWSSMLVEWQHYRWVNMHPMFQMVSTHIVLENLLVCVLGYAHSTFLQWFPYGYVNMPFLDNIIRSTLIVYTPGLCILEISFSCMPLPSFIFLYLFNTDVPSGSYLRKYLCFKAIRERSRWNIFVSWNNYFSILISELEKWKKRRKNLQILPKFMLMLVPNVYLLYQMKW